MLRLRLRSSARRFAPFSTPPPYGQRLVSFRLEWCEICAFERISS
jgi:hypothetical protein